MAPNIAEATMRIKMEDIGGDARKMHTTHSREKKTNEYEQSNQIWPEYDLLPCSTQLFPYILSFFPQSSKFG